MKLNLFWLLSIVVDASSSSANASALSFVWNVCEYVLMLCVMCLSVNLWLLMVMMYVVLLLRIIV